MMARVNLVRLFIKDGFTLWKLKNGGIYLWQSNTYWKRLVEFDQTVKLDRVAIPEKTESNRTVNKLKPEHYLELDFQLEKVCEAIILKI